jgi:hypothetical protein
MTYGIVWTYGVGISCDRLLGLLLEPGDEIIPVCERSVSCMVNGLEMMRHTLALLEATKSHLGAGNVLLGVLEVFELCPVSRARMPHLRGNRTRVSSFHVMPFCLLASVYEKPSTEPVLRPNRPCRLGPILLPSDSTTVWHCAHLVLNRLAPFFESPTACLLACIQQSLNQDQGFAAASNHELPPSVRSVWLVWARR